MGFRPSSSAQASTSFDSAFSPSGSSGPGNNIAFRAASPLSGRTGSDTTTPTATLPAGTAQNDLVFLLAMSFQAASGGVSINTPAGWTLMDQAAAWGGGTNDNRSALFWRVMPASPTGPAVGTASASWLDLYTVGFSGVNTASPIDVAGTWGAPVSNPANGTVPAITTLSNNDWWLAFSLDSFGSALTSSPHPASWTNRSSVAGNVGSEAAMSIYVASAGAQGSTTFPRTTFAGSFNMVLGCAIKSS